MTALPEPLPLDEAQARMLAEVEPLASEAVDIEQAAGLYLAEPVIARRTQPPADLSAMDGYAIRTVDLPGPWHVIGESAAGHPFVGTIEAGEAVRISTGAQMPDGADTVLIQEEAARDGDTLTLAGEAPSEGRHIRRAGFDFKTGETVLQAGNALGPAQLALAFSAGHQSLVVGRLPKVAIFDSGDELASNLETARPEQIPASNGLMLVSMVAPLACHVRLIGPVADDPEALKAALAEADDCDVLITSGGASVGDHDLIRPALEEWGAAISFWRVLMKPGKPIMFARRGKQVILGLPGNPVSAFVTAHMFALPVLRKLAGAASPLPRTVRGELAGPLPATGKRLELPRAVWDGAQVVPVDGQDSSALRALSVSNALIRRDPHSPEAQSGMEVRLYPF